MKLRRIALLSLVVAAALASGCEEQRVVHDRPLVIRRPVQQEYVEVVAPRPPPPRIEEEVEQSRPGYFWVRGYWRWNGRDYVAVRGHWEPVRPGYRYVRPHWEQRPDGWHWHAGIWIGG